MKPTYKILTMVAVFLTTATAVSAQTTADATADILSALQISNASGDAGDLRWGDIVPGSLSESVVTIDANTAGARSLSSGDAVLRATNEGGAAEFTISGIEDAVVNLSLTNDFIVLGAFSTNTMNATIYLSDETVTLTGGSTTVYVGGSLTVMGTQLASPYSTTFEVNAEYQ